jgi:GT2 family glycosyltransferase
MLAHARGRYVTVLAADDVWLPGKLLGQVQHMESLPEDVGVLYSDAYQIDETGRMLPGMFISAHRASTANPEGWIFDTLLEGNFIPGMTALIRRSCFEVVGGYDERLAFEDYDMWLRIARRYRFRFWPVVSARYRIVATSMTRTRSAAMVRSTERILIKCAREGWLSGASLGWARHLDYTHTLEQYQLKRSERFGEALRLFQGNRSATNLLLMLCCWCRIPFASFERLLRFKSKMLGRGRPC